MKQVTKVKKRSTAQRRALRAKQQDRLDTIVADALAAASRGERSSSLRAVLHTQIPTPVSERLDRIETVIADLNTALRQAIERKPNAVLAQLVYQLKATRVELAAVQEQLAANNTILERYVRAPVLDGIADSGAGNDSVRAV